MVDGDPPLNAAIDGLVGVDLDALADGELDELVIGLQRARHRLAGATAGPVARWDASGVWRMDGSRSAAARLARDGGMSMTTAHVELRRARQLRAMRVTAAAVRGRAGVDGSRRPARPGRSTAPPSVVRPRRGAARRPVRPAAPRPGRQGARLLGAARRRRDRQPAPPARARACTPQRRWMARSASTAAWVHRWGHRHR